MTRARRFADLWNRGSYDKALSVGREALGPEVSPDERAAMSKAVSTAVLGAMHLSGAHVTEAAELSASLSEATTGAESEATWRAVATLARHHQRNGRLDDGIRAAQRADAIAERQPGQPHLADAAMLIGDLALAAGRAAEAETCYRRALDVLARTGRDMTNDALRPIESLISCAERAGRDDEVEGLLKRRLACSPSTVFERASVMIRLGALQARRGRTNEALGNARRAAALLSKLSTDDGPDVSDLRRQVDALLADLDSR